MKKTLGCLLLIMLLVVAGCSFGGIINYHQRNQKNQNKKL